MQLRFDGKAEETSAEELRPKKNLQPGDLHPYWPEWRWDGKIFRKA
jgi:hypothetical protein